ncbi:MAG TPA: BadF/BadG/BcrA/BcrD ATPase family protein [Paracoccaceae bacterium]
MTFFLGIDGGGTGCRAAVADASGHVLGQARGGPANIASDPGGARANILAAATAALAQAVGAQDASAELPRLRAVLGLAGANLAASVARLSSALPFARLRVETDAFIAVKGALHDQDGIVAALGTGSVFASQRDGVVRQVGGRGFVLGDEGSGAVLGRALLTQVLRALDGFVPLTPFLRKTAADMGGAQGIIAFGFSATPAEFATLAPAIAASDDPAARQLMASAEDDIARAIALLQGPGPLPVVFLGGLGQVFAPRFAERWQVCPPLGNGLDGALWLARQGG